MAQPARPLLAGHWEVVPVAAVKKIKLGPGTRARENLELSYELLIGKDNGRKVKLLPEILKPSLMLF